MSVMSVSRCLVCVLAACFQLSGNGERERAEGAKGGRGPGEAKGQEGGSDVEVTREAGP